MKTVSVTFEVKDDTDETKLRDALKTFYTGVAGDEETAYILNHVTDVLDDAAEAPPVGSPGTK